MHDQYSCICLLATVLNSKQTTQQYKTKTMYEETATCTNVSLQSFYDRFWVPAKTVKQKVNRDQMCPNTVICVQHITMLCVLVNGFVHLHIILSWSLFCDMYKNKHNKKYKKKHSMYKFTAFSWDVFRNKQRQILWETSLYAY